MNGRRIYSIQSRKRGDYTVICWGASRFGCKNDREMQRRIGDLHTPGDGKCFCVGWEPDGSEVGRMKTPRQVRAQRIRAMRRRAAKLPLFSDQIEAEEMQKHYYSIEAAEQAQQRRIELHQRFMKRWKDRYTPDKEIRLETMPESLMQPHCNEVSEARQSGHKQLSDCCHTADLGPKSYQIGGSRGKQPSSDVSAASSGSFGVLH